MWDDNQASWMIKKILNAKRTLEAADYEVQDVAAVTKFSTQTVHYKLGGTLHYSGVDEVTMQQPWGT